jgi:DNA-directed RNA polymerase subunit RPC12/RpoP
VRECGCSRVTENYLCTECEKELGRLILLTPWLIHELGINAARQDKTSTGGNLESKTASKSRPDMVNFGAMVVADELAYLVASGGPARNMARHPSGPKFKGDLEYLHKRATRIIDIQAPRLRLGECPTEECNATLSPRADEDAYKCPNCDTTHLVQELIENKVKAAHDVLCRPAEAPRILKQLGVSVTVKAVEHWVARKKVKHVEEQYGKKVYRVMDFYHTAKSMRRNPERITNV